MGLAVGGSSFLLIVCRRGMRNKAIRGIDWEVGVASTVLNPDGRVRVRGKEYGAATAVRVEAGSTIRVIPPVSAVLRVEPWS